MNNEYYRNKLLNNNNYDKLKLMDVSKKIFAGGTPKTNNKNYYNGNIYWLKSGEIKFNEISNTKNKITMEGLKNSSAKLIKPYSIVIALTGGTIARCGWTTNEISANQSVCAIEVDESKLHYKFLYYFLEFNYNKIKQLGKGILNSLNLKDINNLTISLPSMNIQYLIVDVLDKFSNIIKNLENGIPKEIELRKKQYLYWRNKLLSFN